MQLLDYIQVKTSTGFADIELYVGDLSAIPKEHEVDIVVLSAFPDNYAPTPHSLIGSLHNKGLSVEKLALDKEMDLRKTLWCWFSKELNEEQKKIFNFQRILCFEPEKRSSDASTYVADIFRCLNNFVFDDHVNHVAMPTVAAGNQRASAIKITEAIIEAGIFWLQRGLPLRSIKIVEINERKAKDLLKVFAKYKQPDLSADPAYLIDTGELDEEDGIYFPQVTMPPQVDTKTSRSVASAATKPSAVPMPPKVDEKAEDNFDIFISYAHKNKEHVRYFIEKLRETRPGLKLFYDSESIPKGGQWLKQISRCIDRSKKVLVFLSREFDESMACWDEFQCAKVRQNRTGQNIIMNIYLLHHPELPTIFEIFNWIDCREADKAKLESAIPDVISALD
jgi:hypothetical protein